MPTQQYIRAVAFDFDGTLANSQLDFIHMRHQIRRVVSRYMSPPAEEGRYILEWLEHVQHQLAKKTPEQARQLQAEAMQTIVDIEVEAARRGHMFQDAPTVLHELKARGIPTCIVTRNCKEGVLTLLPDAYSLCTTVVSRDDIQEVKPDPRHLLHALTLCGHTPTNALMVGDHPMDIVMGIQAGTSTAGVTTGEADRRTLHNAGAQYVVENLSQLMQHIRHRLPNG